MVTDVGKEDVLKTATASTWTVPGASPYPEEELYRRPPAPVPVPSSWARSSYLSQFVPQDQAVRASLFFGK